MYMTICDLCPTPSYILAIYHLEFLRIGFKDNKADRPIDVCQKHYDSIYQSIMGMSEHA